MSIDYTLIFNTPDELAAFCVLSNDEQDAILKEAAKKGTIPGLQCSTEHQR